MSDLKLMNAWVFNSIVNSRAELRLFCLPYAGGGASLYRDWQRMFPKYVDVCPIQLPGRENRGAEQPLSDLKQVVQVMAKAMKPLLDRPFILFGHSMGALLSYELAQELDRQYGVRPMHLFVSGSTAPHKRTPGKLMHKLPDDQFKAELRALNGTPEVLLQNDELMQILLPRIRADFSICETYQYEERPPLACPITVFGGAKDTGVNHTRLDSWKDRTTEAFELHMYDGDHFFIHEEYESMIDCIAGHITTFRTRPVGMV
ncbi:thioesterase II family protein [Paenibacillus sp. YYML68]|uniref:thioesterase II family protein n=1 Tax=Paenibacillus sp. YYML68 TaxID=2909250 RepID=UPI002492FDCD|nr:alpha/beta fold hydrolase [Paenibacillus sp. YYML68]